MPVARDGRGGELVVLRGFWGVPAECKAMFTNSGLYVYICQEISWSCAVAVGPVKDALGLAICTCVSRYSI